MNIDYKYGIMDGYHGDEHLSEDDEHMLRTLHDLNLSDLMGEDHSVLLQKNDKFGFDLHVANEEDLNVAVEKGIHPYAIESLASFCRRFLHDYSRLQHEELIK